jgi:hypothetical protein
MSRFWLMSIRFGGGSRDGGTATGQELSGTGKAEPYRTGERQSRNLDHTLERRIMPQHISVCAAGELDSRRNATRSRIMFKTSMKEKPQCHHL